MTRQCELLGLSKGGLYYESKPMDEYNLELMDLIDKQYLDTPFYGSRKMVAVLKRHGHSVNRKRVQKLMQLMGLEAIYPRPNLSQRHSKHKVYPYLLSGLSIERPNHVWSTDVTYIRVLGGFVYLIAVMDWYSRYILSWRVSNSLDVSFCLEALSEALNKGTPEIFNTDQGSQFTSSAFVNELETKGVKVSMDSKGRFLDNIFIERLWRSLKYEEVYIKDYQSKSVPQATESLGDYFELYNVRRPHQALEYRAPQEVHYAG